MLDLVLNIIIVIVSIVLITRLVYFFIVRKLMKPYNLSECEFNKWFNKKILQTKKRKERKCPGPYME